MQFSVSLQRGTSGMTHNTKSKCYTVCSKMTDRPQTKSFNAGKRREPTSRFNVPIRGDTEEIGKP